MGSLQADVQVVERGGNSVVRILGGDGAGSFTADYTIRAYRLSERMVRMGELGDQIWERTQLHNEP